MKKREEECSDKEEISCNVARKIQRKHQHFSTREERPEDLHKLIQDWRRTGKCTDDEAPPTFSHSATPPTFCFPKEFRGEGGDDVRQEEEKD